MLQKEIIVWLSNHAGELKKLSLRERSILLMRYGLEGGGTLTLQEIGDELDFTRQRVNQIELGALEKLGLLDRDIDKPYSKDKGRSEQN